MEYLANFCVITGIKHFETYIYIVKEMLSNPCFVVHSNLFKSVSEVQSWVTLRSRGFWLRGATECGKKEKDRTSHCIIGRPSRKGLTRMAQ